MSCDTISSNVYIGNWKKQQPIIDNTTQKSVDHLKPPLIIKQKRRCWLLMTEKVYIIF